jgi:cobalt-zinc-cadmium efflux system protein
MHSDHSHSHHNHSHHHPPTAVDGRGVSLTRAFVLGIALNLGFVLVEAIYGVIADSSALLADATHNMGDVLGLVVAWGTSLLARRKPTARHTYGLRRSTLFGALANACLLFAMVGGLIWEAVGRFAHPQPAQGLTMSAVAAIGVLVNGGSALLFLQARKHDSNMRAAFLHLAGDAGVSFAVVVAGALIWKTGLLWLDPLTTLAVSLLILVMTWDLLKEALHLALDGVPSRVDFATVQSYLARLPGVCEVHDLHIWAMSTTEVAMTAHLVMAWSDTPPSFLHGLDHDLQDRFGIHHTTVQIEPLTTGAACPRTQENAV